MSEESAFGSGNVFEDLGLHDDEERLVKADLALKIASVIEARGLSQMEASHLTDVPQPKISLITRGKLNDFSTDRLLRVLNSLGVSVSLVLTEEMDWTPGRTTVHEAYGESSHLQPADEMPSNAMRP